MGTRSAIAVRNPDATYDIVYCHWDGYPEHQMPILTTRYDTAKKARKMIAPGSMSTLSATTDWDGNIMEVGPRYYIDRGELDCQPRRLTAGEIHKFAFNMGCEYLYTYVPRWGWRYDKL